MTKFASNLINGERKVFNNSLYDYLFIICPIWIGLFYLYLIGNFPGYRELIFFFFLFALGESHFAATWLFFTKKNNLNWFLSKKISLIYVPLIILSLFVFVAFINLTSAIYIISVASFFHICRQSIGIFRLYGSNKNFFYEWLIYFYTLFWIVIGLFRFVIPEIFNGIISPQLFENLLPLLPFISFLVIFFAILIVFYFYISVKNISTTASLLTGLLMFAPMAFVEIPQDVTVIGVGIHWCQYLALTSKLYIHKRQSIYPRKTYHLTTSQLVKLMFILTYSFFTASIVTEFGTVFSSKSLFIIVPLFLNGYHFYLDAFIWKFSDPFIRENIGKNIYAA